MIEEYIPHDQRQDDFYEGFLEQRIGNLNSFTEPLAADPIPFLTRPLPMASALTSHKGASVTSSDSGVGAHHVFSPTLPITPEQLSQHPLETETEQPSTSAPTRLLTPIQQFLRYSRKSKAREPSTSNLSHTILILSRFFVPSLVSSINSNKQHFVVVQFLPTSSFFRTSSPNFSFIIFSTISLNFTKSTLTVSGRLLTFGSTRHSTPYFWLNFNGKIQRASSACVLQPF